MGEWHPDPSGRFEQRYFDGTNWTQHVLSGGEQQVDPLSTSSEAISDVYGVLAAMQPSSTIIVWEGKRNDLAAMATAGKVIGAKYRVTEDGLYFEAGILTAKEELIPLWAVTDIDLSQSVTQKVRDVGDLVVHLDTGRFRYGQAEVIIQSISDAKVVRDLIAQYANLRRNEMLNYQQDKDVERRKAGATSISMVNSSGSGGETSTQSLASRLKEFAELRDAGILTEAEFQTQKAKILGGA